MKANEAPENVYLAINAFGDIIKDQWQFHRLRDDDVEYTQTDAFIEKAVGYLNSKLYDWVQTTNPNQRSYANTIMKQDFIGGFKKYMKEE